MKSKVQEKEKAIALRKRGLSYKEILKEVHVSKGSLTLWLKDHPLSSEEQATLEEKRRTNLIRGRERAAVTNKMRRVVNEGFLLKEAKEEFERYINEPFFSAGIALYLGGGAKKSWGFAYTSHEKEPLILMVRWALQYLGARKEEVRARLFTDASHQGQDLEEYWAHTLNIPIHNFRRTTQSFLGEHKGSVRIELTKALYLKKIMIWQRLLFERYGN